MNFLLIILLSAQQLIRNMIYHNHFYANVVQNIILKIRNVRTSSFDAKVVFIFPAGRCICQEISNAIKFRQFNHYDKFVHFCCQVSTLTFNLSIKRHMAKLIIKDTLIINGCQTDVLQAYGVNMYHLAEGIKSICDEKSFQFFDSERRKGNPSIVCFCY